MVILLGVIAALVGLSIGGRRADGGIRMASFPYKVQSWAPVLSPLCLGAGIPLQAALRWVEEESGGNPCAIGSPGALGPDGHPREIGLAQLYNPDDLHKLGLSAARLRAPCVGKSGQCARPLTADEMLYAAQGAIALMSHCHNTANQALDGAGARWTTQDAWKLSKLVHALPGLVGEGLTAVTHKLGRPPGSWGEYRDELASVRLSAGTEHYRWLDDPYHRLGDFGKVLNNAAAVGDAIPSGAVS